MYYKLPTKTHESIRMMILLIEKKTYGSTIIGTNKEAEEADQT